MDTFLFVFLLFHSIYYDQRRLKVVVGVFRPL